MPDFDSPYFLLLLAPLLVGFFLRWFSQPAAIAVSSNSYFTGQTKVPNKLISTNHIPLLLEFTAAIMLIIALARPQSGVEIVPETKEGTDIMIALDISNSMDFYDPEKGMSQAQARKAIKDEQLPDRMAVAKEKLTKFIQQRPNDRIGFVLFGSKSYTGCPPTLDHNFLIAQIQHLSRDLFNYRERATNVTSGLTAGINTLLNESEARRTIILITDGENNVREDISPLEAAAIAKTKGITIHTIAVGGDNPIIPRQHRGVTRSSFDTTALKQIAKKADGHFFRAKDAEGFEEVMSTINELEKIARTEPATVYQKDLYPPFLIAASIALLLSVLTRHVLFPEIA